jgi:hypothetical protein
MQPLDIRGQAPQDPAKDFLKFVIAGCSLSYEIYPTINSQRAFTVVPQQKKPASLKGPAGVIG